MKLTEKEKCIAQLAPKYVIPGHSIGCTFTTKEEYDWEADSIRVVPTGRYTLRQWALDDIWGDQFCRQEYLTLFDTKDEAEIAAAKLNILGLHETIEAAEREIRRFNARLILAYHSQGMPVADALHKFIEDYFDDNHERKAK